MTWRRSLELCTTVGFDPLCFRWWRNYLSNKKSCAMKYVWFVEKFFFFLSFARWCLWTKVLSCKYLTDEICLCPTKFGSLRKLCSSVTTKSYSRIPSKSDSRIQSKFTHSNKKNNKLIHSGLPHSKSLSLSLSGYITLQQLQNTEGNELDKILQQEERK